MEKECKTSEKEKTLKIRKEILSEILGTILVLVLAYPIMELYYWLFPSFDVSIVIVLGVLSLGIILLVLLFLIMYISKMIDYKKYGKEYVILEEIIIFRTSITCQNFRVSKKIMKRLSFLTNNVEEKIELFKQDLDEFDRFLEQTCKEKGFDELFVRYKEKMLKE